MKEFFEKVSEFLSQPIPTLAAGACVIISFILQRIGVIGGSGLPSILDPAWIAVIVCGLPILHEAIEAMCEKDGIARISSELLVSMAMLASIVLFFLSDESDESGIFAAGEVAFIMNLGELLESFTTKKAGRGLEKLISLTPVTAVTVDEGGERTVRVTDIKCGDILKILPGERIPVDGEIVKGETSVDQSVLTGESLPVDKKTGDKVYSGTLNCFGTVEIKACAVGEDSSLGRLIGMVREAEEKKAPSERTADRWASILVPVSLGVALVTGIVTGFMYGWYTGVYRAVSIMVVFCPCALVLATPTAIMAAIGQATSKGVLIKSGEALDLLGRCDTFAFDKTGTLTDGRMSVCGIRAQVCDEDALLLYSAAAEKGSNHPLGLAIVKYATDKNLNIPKASSYESLSGRGICAVFSDGQKIYCGKSGWIRECGFEINEESAKALDTYRSQGKATVCTAVSGTGFIGIIALGDSLRPGARECVEELEALGTGVIMLTGDHSEAAAFTAGQAGVRKYYADLLPENKNERIAALKEEGRTVAMVGDGVNDAPALKTADVGISMSELGNDMAADSADIALIHDEIGKLPYLQRLARGTVFTIRFCITLSMVINIVAVFLSVLGLLGPMAGALVHNAGSVLVVTIAALLYGKRFDKKK